MFSLKKDRAIYLIQEDLWSTCMERDWGRGGKISGRKGEDQGALLRKLRAPMQALSYALASIWQCQCWQWFTIYSTYFSFGRWPGIREENHPSSLLSTQGPFRSIPLDYDWASCPPIPTLRWRGGNDRPWESERQCPSSSRSAALLSRRSWSVSLAGKLWVWLLVRPPGYKLSLPLAPQQSPAEILSWF